MDMRWTVVVVGLGTAMMMSLPSAQAADADAAEVPAAEAMSEASHAQILQEIEATRATDPELAAEMERQLSLFEAGDLSTHELELGAPTGATGGLDGGATLAEALPRQGYLGPPVDDGAPPVTGGSGDYLPPAAREELETLFSQGTGDPNSETDRALREEAEKIMEKYGIEHDFAQEGFEHDERGFEHALEQMPAEAHEQMERFFEQEGPYREMDHVGEHEQGMSERDVETMMKEYDAPETSGHEVEMPTHEYEMPEMPTHEYEAPTYEAPQHEYEAPLTEQPEHEYQMPDSQPPEQQYQDAQPPQP